MLFESKNNRHPIFKAEDTWRFWAEQGGKRLYKSKSSGRGLIRRILCGGGGSSGGAIGPATARFETARIETGGLHEI